MSDSTSHPTEPGEPAGPTGGSGAPGIPEQVQAILVPTLPAVPPLEQLNVMLSRRLSEPALEWYKNTCQEVAAGTQDARFASLIALASRHIDRGALEPTDGDIETASISLTGWNPARWTLFEAARVGMILSRPDLATEAGAQSIENTFRYADEGELCALYRSLAFLPDGQRFAWRAAEGCRTNMLTVFEAVSCDTPYPAEHFDDIAWNQMIIKGLFVGAPVWRVWRLDERLSPELARMALDLVDERRSASRDIQPELWACLGEHAGERGLAALQAELGSTRPAARAAAALGFARSGRTAMAGFALETEQDTLASEVMSAAAEGKCDQTAFAPLHI